MNRNIYQLWTALWTSWIFSLKCVNCFVWRSRMFEERASLEILLTFKLIDGSFDTTCLYSLRNSWKFKIYLKWMARKKKQVQQEKENNVTHRLWIEFCFYLVEKMSWNPERYFKAQFQKLCNFRGHSIHFECSNKKKIWQIKFNPFAIVVFLQQYRPWWWYSK